MRTYNCIPIQEIIGNRFHLRLKRAVLALGIMLFEKSFVFFELDVADISTLSIK